MNQLLVSWPDQVAGPVGRAKRMLSQENTAVRQVS